MGRYSPHRLRRYDSTKALGLGVLLVLLLGVWIFRGPRPGRMTPLATASRPAATVGRTAVVNPTATAVPAARLTSTAAVGRTAVVNPTATATPVATSTASPAASPSLAASATSTPPATASATHGAPPSPSATSAPSLTPAPTRTRTPLPFPICRNTTPIPPEVTEYLVAENDSLACLSQRTGLPLEILVRANPQIPDPNMIFPGQVVKLPR